MNHFCQRRDQMVWLQQSARSLGGSWLSPVVDVDLLLVLREDVQLVPQLINNIYLFNQFYIKSLVRNPLRGAVGEFKYAHDTCILKPIFL